MNILLEDKKVCKMTCLYICFSKGKISIWNNFKFFWDIPYTEQTIFKVICSGGTLHVIQLLQGRVNTEVRCQGSQWCWLLGLSVCPHVTLSCFSLPAQGPVCWGCEISSMPLPSGYFLMPNRISPQNLLAFQAECHYKQLIWRAGGLSEYIQGMGL